MLWLGARWWGAQQSLSWPWSLWKSPLTSLCGGGPGWCRALSVPTSSHLAEAEVRRLSACVTLEPCGPLAWLKDPNASSTPARGPQRLELPTIAANP